MSADILIQTEAVTRRFGGFTALKNVSVGFERGKLTSIIGPNGAGKSTYFNVLSGAFPPSEGRVVFDGQDLAGKKQHDFAHIGIAKSFQITNIFPNFSVLENVRIALQAKVARLNFWKNRDSLKLSDEAYVLLDKVGLGALANRPSRELAHGQQRALEIAIALAADPKLLLMDEPTAGMSPEETRSMMDLILALAGERTVILVEHKMKMVMGISDRIVVLHHGELLAVGKLDDIRANDEVKRVYLGQH
ncbi:ABC transporter ATP-binding protein [Noviherbaspirillum sp. CPCC 100848]|uniref:ABC transporter ATP-binding protein n=1 Tax=Noviherbaspirillum album TaxID=3080276 RepID=A0ABU6JDH8_9BURK|nr:ABC transporter ATP-binding protein [Noviherbaspirillum sp. CPCC 100848]MEC4721214.1 ABC transporter ATP-binding protein [Noviherbaspirillum sp. CPCC 100848]